MEKGWKGSKDEEKWLLKPNQSGHDSGPDPGVGAAFGCGPVEAALGGGSHGLVLVYAG